MSQQGYPTAESHPYSRELRRADNSVHSGYALILTDEYGVITRVTCPAPWGVFKDGNAIPGRHISLLLSEQDRHFVRDILQRMRNSSAFSVKAALVYLDAAVEYRAYMDVACVKGPTPANKLFAWRFSLSARATTDGSSEYERRLERRVEVLERHLELQKQTAVGKMSALNALTSSVQTLAQSLRINRGINQQQSRQICELTAERNALIKRIREEQVAANIARQAEQGVRDRLDLLTDTSWALAEILDMDTALQRIANMIVPEFADCCVIDLLDEERAVLTHAVVACANPVVKSRIEALPDSGFNDAAVTHPLRQAIFSGYSSVAQHPGDLAPGPPPQPAGFLDYAEQIGISGYIVSPLRTRERIVGTITLASTEPNRHYLPEDLSFAEDMALRVAQALVNAWLSQDVQQASRERRDHLSLVSHELRSPMSVISGFAHLLQQQVARPDVDRERIAMLSSELQDGVSRLATTASGLLLPDNEGAGIEKQPHRLVDLTELVTAIVERLDTAHGPARSVNMLVPTPPSLNAYWNAAAIEHAVELVLSHALKHSTAHSTVNLTLEQQDGHAVLAVQVAADSQMINDPKLVQQPDEDGLAGAGSGLGLYMARRIIARQGGSIALEDRPGHAFAITLRIPIPGMEQ